MVIQKDSTFMETALLLVYSFFYIIFKVVTGVEDDPVTKDKKKMAEGLECMRRKDFEKGLEYFTRMLQDNPKSALAWASRGKCNLALGNLYAALSDCTKASSLENNLPEAYMDKGKAYTQLQEYKEALREFDKAAWYFRDSPEAFRWRGLTYLELGNKENAYKDLRKAVSLGDEDANYILLQRSIFVRKN
jgi:tetratricopeptide (TPR) repeat protein